MEKKLKDISLHLLDLGKRNRLLNYKTTGLRAIDVLNNDLDKLFDKITKSSKLTIFQLDAVLEKYAKTIDDSGESIDDYSISKVKDIAYPILKANDVLCYKKGTLLGKVLKSIYKEYKSSMTERGINTLYMTFGLVGYEEKNEQYWAPLLLIPIHINLENGIYRFYEAEDEIILNPTLCYYLKIEKQVVIEPFIENDHSFIEYFSKMSSILKQSDMELRIHSSIGIYSFLKMNMFNDLNEHKDIVLQNNNIKRLLGENVVEESFVPKPIYPVVLADSSQLEAIQYAASGVSFVLQGPPGSGKSQTITNIISTMLGNDKKVLFVSEKQAALNVVFENLKKAGLDSFALELHSHKAHKKEFIDELYKTACLPHYDIKNDAFEIGEKYDYVKHQLEEYRTIIHQDIERLGISIYDIYSRYLDVFISDFIYIIPQIETLSLKDLEKHKELLDRYARLSELLGRDYHKGIFYGYVCKDIPYLRFQAKEDLLQLEKILKDHLAMIERINQLLPLHLSSYYDLMQNVDFLNLFVRFHYFIPAYLKPQERKRLLNDLEIYLKSKAYLDKSTLNHFFDLNILKTNLAELYYSFKGVCNHKFKFLLPSYYQLKKQLRLYTKIKMKDSDCILKLEEALEYINQQELFEKTSLVLPAGYRFYQYELIYQDLCNMKDNRLDVDMDEEEYLSVRNELIDMITKITHKSTNIHTFTAYLDSAIIDLIQSPIHEVSSRITQMNQSLSLLDSHADCLEILDEMKKIHLLTFLDKILDTDIDVYQFSNEYEACYWQSNIYYEVDNHFILKGFATSGVEDLITKFKQLEHNHLEMNKAIVVSKTSKKRPDDSILAGSKFSVLIKEYNKLRKQKPIRLLLEEIFDLILDIKPVFLMSPLSVSTYMNSCLDMFDVVIFDEASQVFAWDALGAIYRAKQCIIIGDSMQMPPTNFFTSVIDTDEDSYENDLESILDKASGLFTTKRLNWHYRSRSEELIEFSNQEFYDHRLITIPQAKSHEEGFGIDYYYLENGIYDAKTRTNRVEAEKIVELVFQHFDTKPEKSLGVLAFSSTQAELIEDLLEDRLKKNPQYQSYFDEQKEEHFFVKNLETVQGDERDKIIFSICYGYNSDHKFYQRFGPLNNVGGERRLNVAITRAKYNICVVSSIDANDIRLENTESKGVYLLKKYLSYVKNIQTPQYYGDSSKDGVRENVAKFLKEEGFLVKQSIGSSDFKIDIAVIHPITKEYMVAIMLDGSSYQIGNCSDVNHLQELLLERFGWQFYRLFSTRWIYQRKVEEEKLLSFLNQVFQGDMKMLDTPEEQEELLIENEEDFNDQFPSYPLVTLEELKQLYQSKKTSYIIDYIVSKEEPIHEDYLLKRICFMYGRTKVTSIVKELFENDLKNLHIIKKDSYFMKKPIISMELRIPTDRPIEYIHPLELQDAIFKIVKRSNGITKEGCFKTIMKLLGYNRMSENASHFIENALIFLKLEGKVIEKEECLYV